MNFGDQGNRVKNLSCREACQKVAVPGGDFGKFFGPIRPLWRIDGPAGDR
jgi:hypothetical protein